MEQVAAVAAREDSVAMEEEDAPVDADQRMPDKDDVAARESEEPEAQETKEETPPNGHTQAPAPAACDDLNPEEEAAAPVPAVVAEAEAPRTATAESGSDGSYDGEDYGRFGFRGESYEVVLAEPRLGMTLENVLEQTGHDADAARRAAAGMRRGALLVAIGGESTFGLLHDEVIDRLRQPRRPSC
ncbi:hypothetical protein JL720_14622 [Aureococcus anophagefferens]|nr:hypothetical protein JL720_14622 [Aureococcus anophagefferens]